jgi:hypothetical protein
MPRLMGYYVQKGASAILYVTSWIEHRIGIHFFLAACAVMVRCVAVSEKDRKV